MLLCRRDGRFMWKMRSKSLLSARRSVSHVYAWVLARSLVLRASVCIDGDGFERIDPMSPACWVEEPEHAVRLRKAAERRVAAAILVVR